MQDKILIMDYVDHTINTWAVLFPATNFEAFVFTAPNFSSDELDALCDQLNDRHPKTEWLWSHPEHGGDSTPVPVLILQDKTKLEGLRDQIGYYDE